MEELHRVNTPAAVKDSVRPQDCHRRLLAVSVQEKRTVVAHGMQSATSRTRSTISMIRRSREADEMHLGVRFQRSDRCPMKVQCQVKSDEHTEINFLDANLKIADPIVHVTIVEHKDVGCRLTKEKVFAQTTENNFLAGVAMKEVNSIVSVNRVAVCFGMD